MVEAAELNRAVSVAEEAASAAAGSEEEASRAAGALRTLAGDPPKCAPSPNNPPCRPFRCLPLESRPPCCWREGLTRSAWGVRRRVAVLQQAQRLFGVGKRIRKLGGHAVPAVAEAAAECRQKWQAALMEEERQRQKEGAKPEVWAPTRTLLSPAVAQVPSPRSPARPTPGPARTTLARALLASRNLTRAPICTSQAKLATKEEATPSKDVGGRRQRCSRRNKWWARAQGVKRSDAECAAGFPGTRARAGAPPPARVSNRADESYMQVHLRDAGARVVEVLPRHCPCAVLEKTSTTAPSQESAKDPVTPGRCHGEPVVLKRSHTESAKRPDGRGRRRPDGRVGGDRPVRPAEERRAPRPLAPRSSPSRPRLA